MTNGSMTKCDNPLCSCDPCTCATCACGVARLGELERRVMDILWEQPTREFTGRDVADMLPESAYTTVATVLDRLVHKGLVRRRMDRGSIQFATKGTRAAYTAVLMRDALAADREPESALVRFAENLSPAEVADPSPLAQNARREAQEVKPIGSLISQIIKTSMNAMATHMTTWLVSSSHGALMSVPAADGSTLCATAPHRRIPMSRS